MNLSLTDEQKDLRVRSFPIADENEILQAEHAPGYHSPSDKLAGDR